MYLLSESFNKSDVLPFLQNVLLIKSVCTQNQFAVPQNRGRQAAGASTVTVDLTQDSSPSFRRNRPQRFTCQVCDKVFSTQETLSQHLATHRSPGKLPFKSVLPIHNINFIMTVNVLFKMKFTTDTIVLYVQCRL